MSRYTVHVIPTAWKEIKGLPGHVRQRVRRIVYAITEDGNWIDVLAVRKRPPYDYGDLRALLKET